MSNYSRGQRGRRRRGQDLQVSQQQIFQNDIIKTVSDCYTARLGKCHLGIVMTDFYWVSQGSPLDLCQEWTAFNQSKYEIFHLRADIK